MRKKVILFSALIVLSCFHAQPAMSMSCESIFARASSTSQSASHSYFQNNIKIVSELESILQGPIKSVVATPEMSAEAELQYRFDRSALESVRATLDKMQRDLPSTASVALGEILAIRSYVGAAYRVNEILRRGDLAELNQSMRTQLILILSALNKLIRANGMHGIVYRGIELTPEQLILFQAGVPYINADIMSTTVSRNLGKLGMNTLMIIDSKGLGAEVSMFSHIREGEVLFRPGTKFKVNDIKYDQPNFLGRGDRQTVIYLEAVE